MPPVLALPDRDFRPVRTTTIGVTPSNSDTPRHTIAEFMSRLLVYCMVLYRHVMQQHVT